MQLIDGPTKAADKLTSGPIGAAMRAIGNGTFEGTVVPFEPIEMDPELFQYIEKTDNRDMKHSFRWAKAIATGKAIHK